MRTIALALLACGMTGCAAAPPPGPLPNDLVGTQWRAKTVAGRAVPEDVIVSLGFPKAGQVAGRSGCNRYAGSIAVSDGRLVIGPLAMTRMACPPPQSEVEARFVATIDKVQRLERDNSALVLVAEGEEPSRFLPFTPP
ncbi:MAG: META domain-containing protein [Geminicoccaceae bacterium]